MESDGTKKIDISIKIHHKDLITKASLVEVHDPQDSNEENERKAYLLMYVFIFHII